MKYLPPNWRMLLLIVGMSIAFLLAFTSNNTRLKTKISQIEGQNKVLTQQNEYLSKEREILFDSIAAYEYQIIRLYDIERELIAHTDELENKIKNIKPKYEKANNHAANFTTDSISRYFSNLK